MTPAIDLDSKDILDRTTTFDTVDVKHVLIGWKDLAAAYRGHIDPRAKDRTNEDAATLAKQVYATLKDHPDQIDAQVKANSEDPGSVQSGEPYTVDANTPFMPEFKKLALRLQPNEVGIVKTSYGYHVIERVPPPPPDPLESADILKRPAGTGTVWVQHVLVGWKDVPAAKKLPPDPRAKDRTKEDADKIAKAVYDKIKGGADMAAVMKETSEDPGSKDDGSPYEVKTDAQFVPPFKNMAMRLEMNEVGIVKSPFGWHIMKRVGPPPPDPLESADILKREPPTDKVKVKHILLGWDKFHSPDPRGSKRTRAELETLVKDTLAKLKSGTKFEDLMTSISEDGGSAKSGKAYDITPTARMVDPFKNLSMRLKVGEIGVVKSQYGIHIIERTE